MEIPKMVRKIGLMKTHIKIPGMKLFDFFKKKNPEKPDEVQAMDANQYLIEELKLRLLAQNYKAERSSQYLSLIVNDEIEIATAILDSPEYHPSLMHLLVMTIHKEYFSGGIETHMVGIGNSIPEKVESVLEDYLTTIFPVILDGFSDGHQPEVDFTDDNGILWHPKPGPLAFQGKWDQYPEGEPFMDLFKEPLKSIMPDQKINWLKIYLARMEDNRITAECLFNNLPWQEGSDAIYNYGKTWSQTGTFLSQKQFIVIRRCDAFDPKFS